MSKCIQKLNDCSLVGLAVLAVLFMFSASLSGQGPALASNVAIAGPDRPSEVPEDYVITPFGYFHPSCVFRIEEGETLLADGYQTFAGPAPVCDVVREDIVVNPNRDEDTYRHGKIWYARLIAGDRLVPVRMEFDTAFGAIKGYLAKLHGRGVDLHLMRE